MNVNDLTRFIASVKLFSRTDTILLAVSGGIDSTVMAHLFRQAKFRFAIAHCNFGLRGRDSDDDAEFVRQLAHDLDARYFTVKFDTQAVSSERGISIQMAARDLRYEWFGKIRQENGLDWIATAHHLDDQAETFLMNLIRGTGIAGLHGIPVKNGMIIRPLMFAFRRDIAEFAAQNKISFRTDHSNSEIKYLRNKIRHEVIPLLSTINPEFVHGLTDTISRIREFERLGNSTLDEWRRLVLINGVHDKTVEIKRLLQVSPVEQYAWALLSPFGFNETQVSNILCCLEKEESKVFNSPTHRLVKDRGHLVISSAGPHEDEKPLKIGSFTRRKRISRPVPLVFQRIKDVANYEIPVGRNAASMDFDKLRFPLVVRRWHEGDTFFPLGMKKRKKLSDFFIDQKFSLTEKERTWLVCSGHDIVWIIGHRIDHRYRITLATREILSVMTSDK